MDWQKGGQKRPYVLLTLILLLAFGLRLLGLAEQSLWWDELKTWERATMPLNEMFSNLIGIRDQVPLYYGLMRFWTQIGTDAPILRLFSVFLGTVSIPLIYKIGALLYGRNIGLLASFLLAISPFHIWYSQEVRMYALLLTLLLLAHSCLLYLLQENKWQLWLAYGLTMTAALYTHYFSFFVVIIHYIFFVLHMRQIRRQTIGWFITIVWVSAAFMPWAYLVTTKTAGYSAAVPSWLTLIHWYDLPLTVTIFAAGAGLGRNSLLAAISALVFVLGIGSSLKFMKKKQGENAPFSKQTMHSRLLLIWLILPLTIIFLVSLENNLLPIGGFSIYNDRYLIISLPPFLLLAAMGWQRWRRQTAVPRLILILVTAVSGISLWQQASNPEYARSGWATAFAQMESVNPETAVIIGHKDSLLPVAFYGKENYPFVQIPPPESDEITPLFAETMAQQLALAAENHHLVWHAEQVYNLDPHGFPDTRNEAIASTRLTPTQLWLNDHFRQLAQLRLPGIRLTLYDMGAQTE